MLKLETQNELLFFSRYGVANERTQRHQLQQPDWHEQPGDDEHNAVESAGKSLFIQIAD